MNYRLGLPMKFLSIYHHFNHIIDIIKRTIKNFVNIINVKMSKKKQEFGILAKSTNQ